MGTPVLWFALVVYHSQLVLVGGMKYINEWSVGPVTKINSGHWTNMHSYIFNGGKLFLPWQLNGFSESAVEYSDNILSKYTAGGEGEQDSIDIVEVYNGHHWAKTQCDLSA